MKRTLQICALSLFSLAMLAGCNTMAGAGKDIQRAGDKIEDAAS
jgi:entericidin A